MTTQERKEPAQLHVEREILSKVAAWFAREIDAKPQKNSRFVKAHRAFDTVATQCRLLGFSISEYYAWLKRTITRAPISRTSFPGTTPNTGLALFTPAAVHYPLISRFNPPDNTYSTKPFTTTLNDLSTADLDLHTFPTKCALARPLH